MALYFAVLGAILFGAADRSCAIQCQGTQALESYIRNREALRKEPSDEKGVCAGTTEIDEVRRADSVSSIPVLVSQKKYDGVDVGLDGGFTSTKVIALSREGEVLSTSYRL